MIYSVLLISAVQQSDSAMCTHTHTHARSGNSLQSLLYGQRFSINAKLRKSSMLEQKKKRKSKLIQYLPVKGCCRWCGQKVTLRQFIMFQMVPMCSLLQKMRLGESLNSKGCAVSRSISPTPHAVLNM